MNAKRFIAPDMRRALKLVRDELGDNAVILQNKTIPEGVELIATNEDVSAVFKSFQQRASRPQRTVPATTAHQASSPLDDVMPKDMRLAQAAVAAAEPASASGQGLVLRDRPGSSAGTGSAGRSSSVAADIAIDKAQDVANPALPNPATENSSDVAVSISKERSGHKAHRLGSKFFGRKNNKANTPSLGAASEGVASTTAMPAQQAVSTDLGGGEQFEQVLGSLMNTETVRYAKKRKGEMNGGLLAAEQVAQIREAVAQNYDVVIDTLKEEVDLLRRLLTTQAAEQRWEQFSCTQPLKAHLLQQLIGAGYLPNLARGWIEAIGAPTDLKSGWKALLKLMLAALPTSTEGIFAQHEAVALVGPTGSGKTSTIGKLAAAFVLSGRTDELAIISTDAYRIGAQDQLRTLCQIIGVPLTIVDDHLSLRRALSRYAGQRKVLVDTAGLTQQDSAWHLQMQELESCRQSFASFMVVSTTNQLSVHVKALQDYAALPLSGCILTKLDECGRLGGSLSAVMQAQLPIAFTTSGMRIPEDLECADALKLIKQSLSGSLGDYFDPLFAQSCFDSMQATPGAVRGAGHGEGHGEGDGERHGEAHGEAHGEKRDINSLLNVCGL